MAMETSLAALFILIVIADDGSIVTQALCPLINDIL
jgi:hypothetical protein